MDTVGEDFPSDMPDFPIFKRFLYLLKMLLELKCNGFLTPRWLVSHSERTPVLYVKVAL